MYRITKEKIEEDILILKAYYNENPDKFKLTDVDVMVEAMKYLERREKFSEDKFSVDSKGVDELIKRILRK